MKPGDLRIVITASYLKRGSTILIVDTYWIGAQEIVNFIYDGVLCRDTVHYISERTVENSLTNEWGSKDEHRT